MAEVLKYIGRVHTYLVQLLDWDWDDGTVKKKMKRSFSNSRQLDLESIRHGDFPCLQSLPRTTTSTPMASSVHIQLADMQAMNMLNKIKSAGPLCSTSVTRLNRAFV